MKNYFRAKIRLTTFLRLSEVYPANHYFTLH